MITVKEFIDTLQEFPGDMQIVIAQGNEGLNPYIDYFKITDNLQLSRKSGKNIVIIDTHMNYGNRFQRD